MAAFGRAVCYRCFKPQPMCLCGRIPRVDNRTPVWIVQHPRERFHPIGTERIARLGLTHVEVKVCHREGVRLGALSHQQQRRPVALPADAVLLYPGDDVPELTVDTNPGALVIIDGTWAHAHTIFRDTPWLQTLPRYRLTPRTPSRYRLRLEPTAASISTIEAIVEALLRVEPATAGLADLLASFEAMIDDQLHIINTRRTGKRTRKRPRSTSKVPRALHDGENLVLVYGEAKSRGLWRKRTRRLVHWTALRVSSGEIFDRVVCQQDVPDGERLSERHAWHMCLDATDLATGSPLSEVAAAWRAFVRPKDLFLAWNKSTVALWRALAELAPHIDDVAVPSTRAPGTSARSPADARPCGGAVSAAVAAESVHGGVLGVSGVSAVSAGSAVAAGGRQDERMLLLKSVYQRMRGRVRGTLDDVVRAEALVLPTIGAIRGRARQRIANGLAILRMMQRESGG